MPPLTATACCFPERYTQIEFENRILLEKMSQIMQSNSLDNINRGLKYSKSLNRVYRKRQLQKITAENQAILQRIQTTEPTYNHWIWEEQRKEQEHYMHNICEYKPRTALGRSRSGRSGLGSSFGSRIHTASGGMRPRGMMGGGYSQSMEGGMGGMGGFRPNTAPMASGMGGGMGGMSGMSGMSGGGDESSMMGVSNREMLQPLEQQQQGAGGGVEPRTG